MAESKPTTEIVWKAPGPVAMAFVDALSLHPDDVLILTGPVASGKNGCIAAAIAKALAMQRPSADGIKRLKVAIVRATYSRLTAATVPSFLHWFPESIGKLVKGSSPITYEIQADGVHLQILFVAIDRPDEASRIMGADLSFAVIDEAREVDESVIAALLTRCGRFPALNDGSGGAAFRGMLITSNKSDTRHWLHKVCVLEPRKHWRWFDQPGGLHPDAENLSALPGGRDWYGRLAASLPPDQVEVLVHNRWGFLQDGVPVFRQFSATAHVAPERIRPAKHVPLVIGADIGTVGTHPGATILQFLEDGVVLVLGELYGDGLGAIQFGRALRQFVALQFPDNPVEAVYADPAAVEKSGIDATLPADAFAAATGWRVRPSPTRSMQSRIEVGQSVLGRMVNGVPALRIDPTCTALISGLVSKFAFKELSGSGGKVVSDQILKTHPEGDVVDGFLYALGGAGEYSLIRGAISLSKTKKQQGLRVFDRRHDAYGNVYYEQWHPDSD